MKTKRLELAEWSAAYWESSGREGSIVFLHPNSSSKRIFEKQFESDLGQRYRLISPDLPGHGQTTSNSKKTTEYSISTFTDFLLELCQRLHCEDAVFVGNSLGGNVLLQSMHLLRKAKGLMIMGTPPLGNPPEMAAAFLAHPVLSCLFQEELSGEQKRIWSEAMLTKGQRSDTDHIRVMPKFFQDELSNTDPKMRRSIGRCISSLDFLDEVLISKNLKIPLAILHGREDQLVNLDYLQGIHFPTLWRGRIEVIANAGHLPQWEQAQIFNGLLSTFMGILPGSGIINGN